MSKLKSTQLLLLGFVVVIFTGTIFLLLPISVKDNVLSFEEALFTSTSATCVTGLSIIDIGSRLSSFGQIIVLILIQIGGLGIMTFSTFFILLISERFTIKHYKLLHYGIPQYPFKELRYVFKSIILFTVLIEIIGFIFYYLRFIQEYSISEASYYALFHSVSAFCNSGFSLFENSFMGYENDLIINFTSCFLILFGGIGFIVILDIFKYVKNYKKGNSMKLSYHTKVVVTTSFVLIVLGTILFFIFEEFNETAKLPIHTRILSSLFLSITSRTAGFNTIEIGTLTNASLLLISLLMIIGASPSSCGGGIKTSTFAIILAMILARFRNSEDVNIFHRRISGDIISKAVAISFFSIFIISFFTLLLLFEELGGLSHTEVRGSFIEIFFEVISAFGTVGLSTGITKEFSTSGHFILIILMFIGRLGPLTIAMAVSPEMKRYQYPKEDVLVG